MRGRVFVIDSSSLGRRFISAVVKLLLQNIYFCVLSRISCNIDVGCTIFRDEAIYVVNRLVLTEVTPVGTF